MKSLKAQQPSPPTMVWVGIFILGVRMKFLVFLSVFISTVCWSSTGDTPEKLCEKLSRCMHKRTWIGEVDSEPRCMIEPYSDHGDVYTSSVSYEYLPQALKVCRDWRKARRAPPLQEY